MKKTESSKEEFDSMTKKEALEVAAKHLYATYDHLSEYFEDVEDYRQYCLYAKELKVNGKKKSHVITAIYSPDLG